MSARRGTRQESEVNRRRVRRALRGFKYENALRRRRSAAVVSLVMALVMLGVFSYLVADSLLNTPPPIGATQSFVEETSLGNLTFVVVALFEAPDVNYMVAGTGISVRVGLGPPDFAPGGEYLFRVNFSFSHYSEPPYYSPFSEGHCLLNPHPVDPNGTVWDLMAYYGECWIYYDIPGEFPVTIDVDKVVRNQTSFRIETVGERQLNHFISVAPLQTELQDRDTIRLERVTILALMIAVVSLVMQMTSLFREATQKADLEADELAREIDAERDEELVEKVAEALERKESGSPPPE